MILLGIDPGATTGWCAYDTDKRVAIASGCFERDETPRHDPLPWPASTIVIERPVAHGPTRPEVVECARIEALIFERFRRLRTTHEMTRLQVRQTLQAAVAGTIRVWNDATVWAALKALHGDGCDAKPRRKKGVVVTPGGAIGEVKGHARAALAVAVAWWLARETKA